jgi:ElaB/YqjD/DUF883 family membrane-anchored ribosome-binding protein
VVKEGMAGRLQILRLLDQDFDRNYCGAVPLHCRNSTSIDGIAPKNGDFMMNMHRTDLTTSLTDQIDKLQSQVNTLTVRLAKFLDEEKSALQGASTVARRLVSQTSRRYGDQINELAGSAGGQLSDLQDAIYADVKRHPLRALAIVGGIGLLLGAFTRRR